jgi:hypothetical protein
LISKEGVLWFHKVVRFSKTLAKLKKARLGFNVGRKTILAAGGECGSACHLSSSQERTSTMKKGILRCAALLPLLGGIGSVRADVLYTLSTDSKGDSATAYFQTVTVNGKTEIEVTVTNTETTTAGDSAQAISDVQFTIGGSSSGSSLTLPTSLTELSGNEITYSGQGAGTPIGFVDYSPYNATTDPNYHWGFLSSGTTVSLIDVGNNNPIPGVGQPAEMIVAAGSSATSNSLSNFNPSFNGSANFFLAVSSAPADLTLNDIKNVNFSFGTGPEDKNATAQTGVYVPPNHTTDVAAPEPSTLMAGCTGVLLGLGYWWRRYKSTANISNN